MDFTNLESFLKSEETPYIIGGAVAFATGVLGYICGRISRKARLSYAGMRHTEKLSELELERERVKHSAELKKIESEASARTYAQKKEEVEMQHRIDAEYKDAEHKRESEKEEFEQRKLKEEREYKLALVERVTTNLKPELEKYFNSLEQIARANIEPELLKKRQEYREKLVDELVDYLNSDDDNVRSRDISVNGEDEEKMKTLINMKYPIPETERERRPVLPKEVGELTRLLSKEIYTKFDEDDE